jgi:hypothetical protein
MCFASSAKIEACQRQNWCEIHCCICSNMETCWLALDLTGTWIRVQNLEAPSHQLPLQTLQTCAFPTCNPKSEKGASTKHPLSPQYQRGLNNTPSAKASSFSRSLVSISFYIHPGEYFLFCLMSNSCCFCQAVIYLVVTFPTLFLNSIMWSTATLLMGQMESNAKQILEPP